jgi:predicted DNA-binding ArsR family transcriptional regulator
MEKDIMANHVYYNIDIDSTEEGLKAFEDTLVTTTKTQLNWEQKEIKIEELADIHTLAFMPDAGELDEYENGVISKNGATQILVVTLLGAHLFLWQNI